MLLLLPGLGNLLKRTQSHINIKIHRSHSLSSPSTMRVAKSIQHHGIMLRAAQQHCGVAQQYECNTRHYVIKQHQGIALWTQHNRHYAVQAVSRHWCTPAQHKAEMLCQVPAQREATRHHAWTECNMNTDVTNHTTPWHWDTLPKRL